MEAWVWLKGQKVIKNLDDLLDKTVVVKRNGKKSSYHVYLHVITTRKSGISNMGALFSNEDFWVGVHPEDEVMILK